MNCEEKTKKQKRLSDLKLEEALFIFVFPVCCYFMMLDLLSCFLSFFFFSFIVGVFTCFFLPFFLGQSHCFFLSTSSSMCPWFTLQVPSLFSSPTRSTPSSILHTLLLRLFISSLYSNIIIHVVSTIAFIGVFFVFFSLLFFFFSYYIIHKQRS